ncbi:MAG: hypothetical protein N3A01_00485 [Bacteroidales bacterium]|nr:hypothetical protein [Bacteroidales bacterium]
MADVRICKKLTFLYLILLSFALHQNSFSQVIKAFSYDQNLFLEKLFEFIESKDKQLSKELYKEILPYWNSYYNEKDKAEIITISNLLLSKKALAIPHFEVWIRLLIIMGKQNFNKNHFNEVCKGLKYACTQKTVTLNFIRELLENVYFFVKSFHIYNSPTTIWQVRTTNYNLLFTEDNLILYINKGDIICNAKGDSSVIYKTTGEYNFFTNELKGRGGTVTWERTGLNATEVYVTLQNYKIDTKKSNYEADSVIMINKRYFNEPIMGKLIEKLIADVDTSNATYPQFYSYSKRHKIKKIFPHIDYEGGFILKGNKFYGEGTRENLAIIKIYYKDTLKMLCNSLLYIFSLNGIVSQNTYVCIYIEKDSIYHNNIVFKYSAKTNEIVLLRTGEGLTRGPFYDTYHRLEIDAPYMVWKIGNPMLLFKPIPGATNKKATFESMDYFSRDRYLKLQGYDSKSPLQHLRDFSKKIKSLEFNEKDFANYIVKSLPQTRQLLLSLYFNGFIYYNPETGDCKIKDKTFFYLDSNVGKSDYDVISFESEVVENDANALLSFLDNSLKLKGVKEIYLSDSQNVVIFPKDQEIIVRKNRDFIFDGKIRAGLFLFVGSNFFFSYEKFKLTLTDINYIKMRVKSSETDAYGNYIEKDVTSIIENATGEIYLDDPNNKSSTKKYPQYPIFISQKESYVFYEYPHVFNNIYKKDKFYFQVYKFELDSINNLTRKNLRFKGNFVSAGIFPPFEEELIVMEDYSLGFKHKTPTEGYPAYGNKGVFKNIVKLSNRGLRGDGSLEYIRATINSNDFLFFPDSANALAQEFIVHKQEKGVEFPDINGKNIKTHWEPYNDNLIAENTTEPFTLYNEQAKFFGAITLRPNGVEGNGKLEFSNAELLSSKMKFLEHTVNADTSNFNLKTLETAEFSFKTNNVNAHIDFNQRMGEFKSNGAASFVEFPKNQYLCFMDQFTWYMDKSELELSASRRALATLPDNKQELSPTEQEDIQLQGSKFVSIHPDQDSLWFVAPSAKYNLKKFIIAAQDVKYIRVADATIYPSDGNVVIEKNAVMQTLKESKIIANNTTRYHKIYNATTNIYGRKKYSASGFYDYFTKDSVKQTIKFEVISVDSTYQTYAIGKIGITDNFKLSPHFEFTGNVLLFANEPFLTFDGSVKISHECEQLGRYWLNFKASINPSEIYIPISDTLFDINNRKLFAGLLITNDSSHIYPAFLMPSKNYSDIPVFKAKGFLTYDENDGKYKISHKDKLQEFNMPGNYLSLHHSICNMYAEGKINLGINTGQFKINAYGSVNHDVNNKTTDLDLILTIDFFFNENCMELFFKDIQKTSGFEPVDLSRNAFVKGLYEILGEKKTNELLSDFSLGKFKRPPKELEHTISFFDLKLHWNSETHSYIGDTLLGIGLIGKDYINVKIPGYIEILKKRGGDKVHIYFQLNDNIWYFFSYSNNLLQVLSSNEEFNNLIKTLKPEQRKLKTEKGEVPYSFSVGSISEVKKFKNRMRTILAKQSITEDEKE